MRLSVVFELLLIFILIAFAASRVIEQPIKDVSTAKSTQTIRKVLAKQEDEINKYCTCSESFCNCCREFRVPIVNINGPGCAVLRYEADDNLGISLSFADRVIAQRVLSGRRPRPVCMPLPGGFSKFCGRVYNIGRAGEDFKACLGLELHSSSTVEAAVRVSCFKFGPRGVTTEEAEPLPLATEQVSGGDDDDDDDDDDDLGFGSLGDDDDDDDEDDDDEDDDDEDDDDEETEDDDAEDASDYTGFSILEGLFETESTGTKKPSKKKIQAANQVASASATVASVVEAKPTSKPVTSKPLPSKRKPTKAPPKKQSIKVSIDAVTSTESAVSQTSQKIDEPAKNASALNLLHTSALLQLANKPSDDEQNEVYPSETVDNLEKVPLIEVKKPLKPSSDSQAATTLQDLGIQSSISYITGQLSEIPSAPILSSTQSMIDKKGTAATEVPQNYNVVDTSISEEEKQSKESVEDDYDDDDDDDLKDDDDLDDDSKEDDDDDDDYADSDEKVTSQRKKGSSTTSVTKKDKKKDEEDDDILGFADLSAIGESLGLTQKTKKKKNSVNSSSTTPSTTTTKKKKKNEGILGQLSSITGALGLARSRNHRMMNF